MLSKNIEPGDYVAPGTRVVTVGDLINVWLRAYIDESDMGRVKLGQTAWITTDAYPGKRLQGPVSFISQEAEFTPKRADPEGAREVGLSDQNQHPEPREELNPGMPADAVIDRRAEELRETTH